MRLHLKSGYVLELEGRPTLLNGGGANAFNACTANYLGVKILKH